METVNRYRFTDALFLLLAVLLVSAVLVLQPFSVHVPVVPVVPVVAGNPLAPCIARANAGNWSASMYDGAAYDACRAYFPYDNFVVSSPELITATPVAP